MMSTVLIKDEEIAFSRLLYTPSEVVIEWPHDAGYTPYGYLIPVNSASSAILDYLEYGPHSPNAGLAVFNSETSVHGVLIDHFARVFHVKLLRDKEKPLAFLYYDRILTGPGAIYALSDLLNEHEKAMMSMRLKPNLQEAVELFEMNTALFNFQYNVYDIPAIAEELRDMGYTLALP